MLVIPFLAGAVIAVVAGNPVLVIAFVCLAACDYAGERT